MLYLESTSARRTNSAEPILEHGLDAASHSGARGNGSGGDNVPSAAADDYDEDYEDDAIDDDPDLAVVRALRRAIITAASAAEDGSGGDYAAALEAFIGPGSATCSTEQFAALLRPLALHWGGSAAK